MDKEIIEHQDLETGSDGLTSKFHDKFTLPTKRNSIGLFEVKYKEKVVYKCKSTTALARWCYRADQALNVMQDQ